MKIFIFILLVYSENLIARNIVLYFGETVTIKSNLNKTLVYSKNRCVFVEDNSLYIKIIAKNKQTGCFLNIGKQHYNFTILNKHQYNFYIKLKHLIDNKLGLRIVFDKGSLTIKGDLYLLSDWIDIVKLYEKNFQTQISYSFKAKIHSNIYSEVSNYIKKELNSNNLFLTLYSKLPLITLNKGNLKRKEIFNSTLKKYGISVTIVKEQESELRYLISVDFIEVNNSISKQYGLASSSQLTASVIPAFANNSIGNVSLHDLKNSGHVKTHSSARLMATDSKPSSLQSGGELPIKHISVGSYKIQWKKYGLFLDLTAKKIKPNTYKMNFSFKVKSIDISNSIEGIPALKSTETTSNLVLKNNTVLIISGLNGNNFGYSKEAMPLLNRLPYIGNLFSSKSFIKNNSQLLLAIKIKELH